MLEGLDHQQHPKGENLDYESPESGLDMQLTEIVAELALPDGGEAQLRALGWTAGGQYAEYQRW
ncbi:hypothetical protein FRB94_007913 [Tulasnella sp. JGI-2019a]|nr:hypothetical protein FRB93_007313 [Tulasnella sp. JGI-2019a]KAG8996984.1 hypothetical protein FRB94_007913 [Tulasnella sp. JGI-2019a]